MNKQYPTLNQEHLLAQDGHTHIAGLDEAGRGAWAGPVSAAAVVLPLDEPSVISQLGDVCDSKLCTPRQRDTLYDTICHVAVCWATSLVPAARIDEIGIVLATRQAMREALDQLDPAPGALLIDALHLPTVPIPQRALKKGDLKCLSIAAASILAKVTRDRAMVAMDEQYPGYGFARHKGYGTRQHRQALQRLGPLNVHRWYFAPVAGIAQELGAQPGRPVRPRMA
jgi:ribonuclease HII